MKVRERADPLWLILQHDTALNLGGLKVVEGAKGTIGNAFVRERPQAFARLLFRRIGWQEEQMDALGNHEVRTGMPACLIKHQQHPLGGTCSTAHELRNELVAELISYLGAEAV